MNSVSNKVVYLWCVYLVMASSGCSSLRNDPKALSIPNLISSGVKAQSVKIEPLKEFGTLNLSLYGVNERDVNWNLLLPYRINTLFISGAKINDFYGMYNVAIKKLILVNCYIADVRTLRLMRVEELQLSDVKFSRETMSLNPSVRVLSLHHVPITDVSSLNNLKLEKLYFEPEMIERGMDILRNMNSIKQINGEEAKDFWATRMGDGK